MVVHRGDDYTGRLRSGWQIGKQMEYANKRNRGEKKDGQQKESLEYWGERERERDDGMTDEGCPSKDQEESKPT